MSHQTGWESWDGCCPDCGAMAPGPGDRCEDCEQDRDDEDAMRADLWEPEEEDR